MKWIKYQIIQSMNGETPVLVNKKIDYSNENLAIAEAEAYDGYTIEEDSKSYDREPLSIEFGGTNATTPVEACKNIGAVPVPASHELDEGYVYLNKDGTTKLANKQFKYSVIIDNGTDGTPSAIEYADDCAGFTPMSISDGVLNEGDWTNNILLDMFKPCVISPNSSEPAYYLDKTNLSKKIDGTDAVLTGEDGDVMIEVNGLIYGRIVNMSDARVKVSISNYREPDSFCFNDFGGEIKSKFYRGRYKAGVTLDDANTMRSISGVTPLTQTAINTCRTKATARGEGYHQNNIYMLFLWQAMYLILFKSRDSQSAFGKGRVSATAIRNCGWSDSYGWIWGNQNGTDGVVFLGVEDFYGNVSEWVDGCILSNLTYKLTRNPNKYDDIGNEYEISEPSGLSNANDNAKYLKSVKGTNDIGFLPASTGGSSATYYCDRISIKDSLQNVYFGGFWIDSTSAGAFCWGFDNVASTASEIIGSRLCRK